MPRGRPAHSEARQNIIELLQVLHKAHGYQLATLYKEIFPPVTMRAVYYHLRKGVETGEFVVASVERSQGHYSWGPEVERIYYSLGKKAQPRGDKRVAERIKELLKSQLH
jgi:hypothetical protein